MKTTPTSAQRASSVLSEAESKRQAMRVARVSYAPAEVKQSNRKRHRSEADELRPPTKRSRLTPGQDFRGKAPPPPTLPPPPVEQSVSIQIVGPKSEDKMDLFREWVQRAKPGRQESKITKGDANQDGVEPMRDQQPVTVVTKDIAFTSKEKTCGVSVEFWQALENQTSAKDAPVSHHSDATILLLPMPNEIGLHETWSELASWKTSLSRTVENVVLVLTVDRPIRKLSNNRNWQRFLKNVDRQCASLSISRWYAVDSDSLDAVVVSLVQTVLDARQSESNDACSEDTPADITVEPLTASSP